MKTLMFLLCFCAAVACIGQTGQACDTAAFSGLCHQQVQQVQHYQQPIVLRQRVIRRPQVQFVQQQQHYHQPQVQFVQQPVYVQQQPIILRQRVGFNGGGGFGNVTNNILGTAVQLRLIGALFD